MNDERVSTVIEEPVIPRPSARSVDFVFEFWTGDMHVLPSGLKKKKWGKFQLLIRN